MSPAEKITLGFIITFVILGAVGVYGFGTIWLESRRWIDEPWVDETHPARTTPWKHDGDTP